jgi:hypothetical protein
MRHMKRLLNNHFGRLFIAVLISLPLLYGWSMVTVGRPIGMLIGLVVITAVSLLWAIDFYPKRLFAGFAELITEVKDDAEFRGLLAGAVAFGAIILFFYAQDLMGTHKELWMIETLAAVALLGAAGGSLWRDPFIGAGCGAIALLIIVVAAMFLWFVTHGLPSL